MPELRYLASARSDLKTISDYIAKASANPATGRKFRAALQQKCRRLASLPGTLGRPRPELRPDLRSVPYKGYIIFFRYRDNLFEVVNIIQSRRDLPSVFRYKT